MRTYVSYEVKNTRTVKAQGEAVVRAMYKERGLFFELLAIKRTGGIRSNQRGFVLLQGTSQVFLCQYSFQDRSLRIVSEESLDASQSQYLECPKSMLESAPATNPRWRECVAIYQASSRELIEESADKGLSLFLKSPYSENRYPEPMSVIKRVNGEWVGVDCYGEDRYLFIDKDTIRAHCPTPIIPEDLKAFDTNGLCEDVINTGDVLYKMDDEYAVLLGRPMTTMEQIEANPVVLAGSEFDFYACPFWM